MLWITSPSLAPRRHLLLQVMAAFSLGLLLTACGSKRSMESAKSDEDLGSVHQEDSATKIEGQEEVSFDEAAERHRRVAGIQGGNTRSGPGKQIKVTTREGDTLWKIAERKDVYGSGWLYPLIYKANKEKIKDPTHLEAGLVLIIPRDVPDPEVEIAKEEAMTGQYLSKAPVDRPVTAPVAAKAPEHGGLGWLWIVLLLAVAGAGFVWWKKRGQGGPPPEATA